MLAPGGQFVVEVPNVADLPRRLQLLLGWQMWTSDYAHGIDGGTLHSFTAATLKRRGQAAGCRMRHVTGAGIFASIRTWWVSLLCGDVIVLAQKPLATAPVPDVMPGS